MQWRLKKLIICAIFVIDLVLICLVWYANQDDSTRVSLFVAGLTVQIPLISMVLKGSHQIDKDKLNHSEHLIREIFEKSIEPASVVYDLDEIHRTDVKWAETNSMFDFAISHLNHQKYKKVLRAYIDGQKDAEVTIIKFVDKIQQYRDIVKYRISDAKLPLEEGEYDEKLINHLIFYDVRHKIMTNTINKKFGLFLITEKQLPDDTIYRLDWCDDYPLSIGACGGKQISKGNRTKMKCLQNIIEELEKDSELRALILEIDCLKRTLENNPNLKMFEDGRQEIINQVTTIGDALDGKCNHCP